MIQSSFGSYLRFLRGSKDPPMSQEMLAEAIGRKKMTISQFEQGKNAPPQGELLNKLIDALALTAEQERQLRFLAAESRNAIPSDIADYFFSNPSICDAIRAGKQTGRDDAAWKSIEAWLLKTES